MKGRQKKTDKQMDETADGFQVETTVRDGVVVETTRDADGNIISVVKWIKPDKRDPRRVGPEANVEQPPL